MREVGQRSAGRIEIRGGKETLQQLGGLIPANTASHLMRRSSNRIVQSETADRRIANFYRIYAQSDYGPLT